MKFRYTYMESQLKASLIIINRISAAGVARALKRIPGARLSHGYFHNRVMEAKGSEVFLFFGTSKFKIGRILNDTIIESSEGEIKDIRLLRDEIEKMKLKVSDYLF